MSTQTFLKVLNYVVIYYPELFAHVAEFLVMFLMYSISAETLCRECVSLAFADRKYP